MRATPRAVEYRRLGRLLMRTVGIDEAGYGPLVGPLVCAAVEFDGAPEEFERTLERWTLEVADSKALYSGPDTLWRLESVTLSMLDPVPRRVGELLEALVGPCERPFYLDPDRPLPIHRRTRIERPPARIRTRVGLRTAAAFNAAHRRLPTKAEIAWELVAAHIVRVASEDGPLAVLVDRQGGRRFYAGHLLRALGTMVNSVRENAEQSVYRLPRREGAVEIRFITRGDGRFRAVGLASVAAKYVREVFIDALNRWLGERELHDGRLNGYGAQRRLARRLAELLQKNHGVDAGAFLRRV